MNVVETCALSPRMISTPSASFATPVCSTIISAFVQESASITKCNASSDFAASSDCKLFPWICNIIGFVTSPQTCKTYADFAEFHATAATRSEGFISVCGASFFGRICRVACESPSTPFSSTATLLDGSKLSKNSEIRSTGVYRQSSCLRVGIAKSCTLKERTDLSALEGIAAGTA